MSSTSQNLVRVIVTKGTAIPARESFNTIMLAAYHTVVGPLVREFGSIDEAETAGFTVADFPAINRALTVMFSQSPRPNSIKLGRRTTGTLTQILEFAPIAAQGTGFVWEITIDGVLVTYTEAPADTPILIVAGLLSAVNSATPEVTATSPVVTILTITTDVDNVVHSYKADLLLFDMTDPTTDPGLATDLSAIQGFDEEWSGLVLDSNSPAEVASAATFIEARIKIFAADAYLSDVVDSGSATDICSVLLLAQRERTYTYWTEGRVSAYYAAALMARVFAASPTPGRETWHRQTIAAVEIYGLLPQGRQQVLVDKRCNHLEPVAGSQITIGGVVAAPQFIDTIRYVDFLAAQVKFLIDDVLNRQTQLEGKVPFTDPGIAITAAPIRVFLQNEVAAKALAPEPAPELTAPKAVDVSVADRAERILTGIQIDARYAGAIHEARVQIFLEV